jgi:hypothetical protein
MEFTIAEVIAIEQEEPERWVDPRNIADLDLDACRRWNFKQYVEESPRPAKPDDPTTHDQLIADYMSYHFIVTVTKGRGELFHAEEFIDATLFLIMEAWSVAATYRLSIPELMNLEETWAALNAVEDAYDQATDEFPRDLLRNYVLHLFEMSGMTATDWPRIRRHTSRSQWKFLKRLQKGSA